MQTPNPQAEVRLVATEPHNHKPAAEALAHYHGDLPPEQPQPLPTINGVSMYNIGSTNQFPQSKTIYLPSAGILIKDNESGIYYPKPTP